MKRQVNLTYKGFAGSSFTVCALPVRHFFTGRVPVHVVQNRLGHKRVETTMNVYANVLPSMQQDAAEKLAALLYG